MFKSYLVVVVLLLIGVNCDDRISYGEKAKEGQFPYQVSITAAVPSEPVDGREQHICGGILITKEWVLTAAHCLSGLPLTHLHKVIFRAYLGSINTITNGLGIRLKEFFPHPKYIHQDHWNIKNVTSDIMLVKLTTPVEFTDSIKPISLPEKDLPYGYFVGKKVQFSGFGMTESGKVSDVLLFANLTVISNQECERLDPNYDPKYPLSNEWICTIPDGSTNPCHGDSGGPLVGLVNNKPVIIGIASAGYHKACGVKPTGAVYTRVTMFLDWIKEIMDQN